MLIVFGQEDYVRRIDTYLSVIKPTETRKVIMLPLQYEQPDKTDFDWHTAIKVLEKYDKGSTVYVAVSVKHHETLKVLLKEAGYINLVFYTSEIDNCLKKKYFKEVFGRRGIPFTLIEEIDRDGYEEKNVKIYMAKCIVDKKIYQSTNLSSYIIPIQVGAALTTEQIAEITDDTGDNISLRNRRYSEMTAFYWMWKNAKADYLGLCHYRRLWVDMDGIVEKLRMTDVDAVLPLPTLCEHSVYEDYLLKHIPDVWRPMMDVLREQSPEYYEASREIFQGRIFYASNMCILKREVLDDLCSWMFPIVMEVENRVGDLQDTYYNRYAGFCTERLITLYFLYNKNNWKIAHAEKVFIG